MFLKFEHDCFQVLSPVARPIFMLFCSLLGGCFYFLGNTVLCDKQTRKSSRFHITIFIIGHYLNDIIWNSKGSDVGKNIKRKLDKKSA